MFYCPCSLESQPLSSVHPFAETTSHSNMYLSGWQWVCGGFSHPYSYQWIAEVVQASALSKPEQHSTHPPFHLILCAKHVAIVWNKPRSSGHRCCVLSSSLPSRGPLSPDVIQTQPSANPPMCYGLVCRSPQLWSRLCEGLCIFKVVCSPVIFLCFVLLQCQLASLFQIYTCV